MKLKIFFAARAAVLDPSSWFVAALLLCATTTRLAVADDTAPAKDPIAQLIDDLDSDRFDVRDRAVARLQQLSEQPEMQTRLARTLHDVLLKPETSLEFRTLCEPTLLRLPAPADQPSETPEPDELERLVVQADGESYGLRLGAAVRLAWLAQRNPRVAFQVADRLKQRLAQRELSSEARTRLAAIWQTARGIWLCSDPAEWPRPTVTDESIAGWVAALGDGSADVAAYTHAERELMDLLAYDAELPRIRTALEGRLKTPATPAAQERLDRVYEWTRPAMAAEIWFSRQHTHIQYLLIDVPQLPEGALRPTHFDRIDDTQAHCKSGNSLAPGDYPVGIALPPTHQLSEISKEGRIFHLVNLSTPRRRMLYEYQHLKIEDSKRLSELSERTVAWLLAQRRILTDREIAMLRQLDPAVVSRFVGPYLLAIDDAPKLEPDEFLLGGRDSRHMMLCLVMAEIGTHDAIPGLVEAIRRGRVPAPNKEIPYHVGWMAALAIAQRDPWAGIDEWLGELLSKDDLLQTDDEPRVDLGATAAAMLLDRHGASPAEFGLVELNDTELRALGVPACRFASPERRQEVIRWWKQHQQRSRPGA